jgi:hypothetical protein
MNSWDFNWKLFLKIEKGKQSWAETGPRPQPMAPRPAMSRQTKMAKLDGLAGPSQRRVHETRSPRPELAQRQLANRFGAAALMA